MFYHQFFINYKSIYTPNFGNMDELIQAFQQAQHTIAHALDFLLQDQQNHYFQSQRSEEQVQNIHSMQQELKNSQYSVNIAEDSVDQQDIEFMKCQEFFNNISSFKYKENLQTKIMSNGFHSINSKRKDDLFKGFKTTQEVFIKSKIKQYNNRFFKNSTYQRIHGSFSFQVGSQKKMFTMRAQDFDKLNPSTDLNDTIINNYLFILQNIILNPQIQQRTHIFSSFFMNKLLGDYLREDINFLNQLQGNPQRIQEKVLKNYPATRRWNRNIDIFSKEYLVFPISAFRHWNCIIVLHPNKLLNKQTVKECVLIYLDSMFEKRSIFSEAIKSYLEKYYEDKTNETVDLSSLETIQILMPRQINTHDCGIYTICYIEFFLKNTETFIEFIGKEESSDISKLSNFLKLFPRNLVYALRNKLRNLFSNLIVNVKPQNQYQIVQSFISEVSQIISEATDQDYDTIDQHNFRKYLSLYRNYVTQKLQEEKQKKVKSIRCEQQFQFSQSESMRQIEQLSNQINLKPGSRQAASNKVQRMKDTLQFRGQTSRIQVKQGQVIEACLLKFYLDYEINHFEKEQRNNNMYFIKSQK